MTAILELNDLTIQRSEFPLCEQVDLILKTGSICHIQGANGAGKTTLLMQIAGLLPSLPNQIKMSGVAIDAAHHIAPPVYISHQLGIHPNLTVQQNLCFLLNLYGISPNRADIFKALEWAELSPYANVSCTQLSAGQTRKVALARLLLMDVEITPLWLLDEPFTALDKTMIGKLNQLFVHFAQSGGAVLLTSHQAVASATMSLTLNACMV